MRAFDVNTISVKGLGGTKASNVSRVIGSTPETIISYSDLIDSQWKMNDENTFPGKKTDNKLMILLTYIFFLRFNHFNWKKCVFWLLFILPYLLKVKDIKLKVSPTIIKRSFQLQADLVICGLFICKFSYPQLQIGHFSGTYPPNLQSFFVFLYANSLDASLTFWSLSIAYNKVQL